MPETNETWLPEDHQAVETVPVELMALARQLAEQVAEHFEGTDAPLGELARQFLAKAR